MVLDLFLLPLEGTAHFPARWNRNYRDFAYWKGLAFCSSSSMPALQPFGWTWRPRREKGSIIRDTGEWHMRTTACWQAFPPHSFLLPETWCLLIHKVGQPVLASHSWKEHLILLDPQWTAFRNSAAKMSHLLFLLCPVCYGAMGLCGNESPAWGQRWLLVSLDRLWNGTSCARLYCPAFSVREWSFLR